MRTPDPITAATTAARALGGLTPIHVHIAEQPKEIRDCLEVLGRRPWEVLAEAAPVDPETYTVKADGRVLTCEPAKVLPMAQRYFLF